MRIQASPSPQDPPVFVAEKQPPEYKRLWWLPDKRAGWVRSQHGRSRHRVVGPNRKSLQEAADLQDQLSPHGQRQDTHTRASLLARLLIGSCPVRTHRENSRKAPWRIVGESRRANPVRIRDKDEAVRFTLQSSQIPALGYRQGLIYFEAPESKTYTVNFSLADLWSKNHSCLPIQKLKNNIFLKEVLLFCRIPLSILKFPQTTSNALRSSMKKSSVGRLPIPEDGSMLLSRPRSKGRRYQRRPRT